MKTMFDPGTPLTCENFADLPPLVTDGAWGTELQKLGARPGELTELWNVDAPDKVFSVARSYVEAGSQVILTNTFSSNRPTLERHGLGGRVRELCRAGAEISRRAALGRAYVFASIGPTGKMVMMGELSPEAVEEIYAEQAEALAEGGADAIVIETHADLVEAESGLRGVLKAVDLPVGVSFTFDYGVNHDQTMMGVTIEQAHEMAARVGASFVGANCGAGIETFVDIAARFRQCGNSLPIWVKGNAGKPQVDAQGRTHYQAEPQLYADLVEPLLAAGAWFIGGCCGSSPAHIKAMADRLASLRV